MLSIADIVDKLIIENIKIFSIRERLHQTNDKQEYIRLHEQMIILNKNRGIISNELDQKIEKVFSGEKNRTISKIKTY